MRVREGAGGSAITLCRGVVVRIIDPRTPALRGPREGEGMHEYRRTWGQKRRGAAGIARVDRNMRMKHGGTERGGVGVDTDTRRKGETRQVVFV